MRIIKHRRLRRATTILYIAILFGSATYFAIVLTDTHVAYINPIQSPPPRILTPVPLNFFIPPNHLGRPPNATFEIDFVSGGPIVANATVSLYAFGRGWNLPPTISAFFLSVQHILSVNTTRDKFGFVYTTGVTFKPFERFSNGTVIFLRNSTQGYWPVPGDYAPVLVVTFTNGTINTTNFAQTSVHVAPLGDPNAERYSRVNQGLTIALVFFALVELGSKIIEDLTTEEFALTRLDPSMFPTASATPTNPKPKKQSSSSTEREKSD